MRHLPLIILCSLLTTSCELLDDDSDNPPNNNHIVFGLDTRPNNDTCIAPGAGQVQPSDITLESAFPNLPNLGTPLVLLQEPDNDAAWYAALKKGEVVRFDNNPAVNQSTLVIDITGQVSGGSEQGLLGMAFHPNYENNGEIFLSYTDNAGDSKISRFTFSNNQWQEEVILAVDQPASNHNGGNIAFGPDRFLYIGLGDGGGGNDSTYNQTPNIGHGQDTRTLLGSMLRIDVDSGSPYSIPSDNPFAGNSLCSDANVLYHDYNCPEIYAWGLRNPWRWSFDLDTGELWAGDVGQNHREEVDLIEINSNYGWKITEGLACRNEAASCDKTDLTDPIVDYRHDGVCSSITGGYVYRGNDPQLAIALQDTYLYADFCNGHLWGLKDNSSSYTNQLLITGALGAVYSFAQGNNGDVFLLTSASGSGTGGNIFKIVPSNPNPPPTEVASVLSETGCVDPNNPTRPASGLIPYDIISPLWSDNAEKHRFIALPNNTTIAVDPDGNFDFPVGTVLMKNFSLNDVLLETRLLMRHANGWGGYSYEWQYDANNNPSDALLLTSSLDKPVQGSNGTQNWHYPSSTECFDCHTESANITLGPETKQLNKETYFESTGRTANQLATFEHINLFTEALIAKHKSLTLYSLDDDSTGYESRVKSYLHSNCSYCHQPDEVNTTDINLLYETLLANMNICNTPPQRDDFGVANPRIIDPDGTYDDPNSIMLLRMLADSTSGLRMPPLASEVVDTQAVDVFKRWIDQELVNCL